MGPQRRRPGRRVFAACLLLGAALVHAASRVHADPVVHAERAPKPGQREPELKDLLQKIISSADCFADRYEAEVWHKAMEPRLRHFVGSYEDRVDILDHVYCEAKRDPDLQMPPDLVLAVIEVESRFDPWAVSRSGAVGLMQVMPFWPTQLGHENELVRTAPNIRMGCEILRFYLRAEHRDWVRALARYNGSVGRRDYPTLIMSHWQSTWKF